MEEIRLLGILILLLASNATADDQETKDYLDPSNLGDRTFLWKHLFIKMNMMLNVTEKMGLGLAAVNKRLDVVDKRQEELTTDITKLSEEIDVIGKELYEMNFKSTDDDTRISLENSLELNEINRKMQKLRQSVNPEKASEEISQISANKRLEEIQKRLQLLWEIEMRTNTSYRLDESKLELDKFWKSVPSVIRPKNNRPWKTILRRQDGSVEFNRNWTDYKHGFGHVNGEFFVGLEALHKLTSQGPPQELLVILQDFLIETRYAKYDLFRIGNEAEKYALTELGTYSGDVGDSLREHKGCNFTTLDQDNGGYSPNCASFLDGGWWFLSTFCARAFLTGPYGTEFNTGKVEWDSWDNDKSLSYAEMLIRSKN